MINLIDINGNSWGHSNIVIIGADGKVKSISGGGGGSPTGPAGGDLSGTYPNPGVNWVNGQPLYDTLYYPLSANPAGYLTVITSGDVVTALGYTPYDASNPAGYISGITSLDVTTALGYTPVNQAGDTMLGYLTLNADPTSALQAATKQYVDNLSGGINFHAPCHVATTGNLSATYLNGVSGVGATLTSTVNAALVIDSHTLAVGERVLVWQQTAGLQNGIYTVTDAGSGSTPWILTRATDADNTPSGELANGDFCFIQQGATYGGFGFILNTTGTITVGVTSINYVQFNAAQVVTAGYGLQELSPNVLSVDASVIATVASLGSYLTSATAAATYYPLTNPSGYISGITGLDVTTALGYTPYNATNPAGYITGITSSDVTTALGYTPYDASNPSGYITSSALTPYLTSATAAATYYPLTNPSGYTSNTGTVTSVAALTLGTTGTDLSSTVANGTTTPVITLNVPTASATNRGALSSADWTTFNNKVPPTRTITINGTAQDLSADRSWTVTAPDPAGWTTIVKSANQDVTNNATPQVDTDLQFSVVAGGHYMVEMNICYSGNNTTGDYLWIYAVSAGTMKGRGIATIFSTTGAPGTQAVTAATPGAATTGNIAIGVLGGDLDELHTTTATFNFYASANATFSFRFSNNAAGAGRISRTWKGSILKYKRID